MSFLCSQTKPRNNITISELAEPELLVCEESIAECYDQPVRGIKRRYSEEIDPFEESSTRGASNSTQSVITSDDSDYHFLMSLLPFLKEIPQHRKLALRMRLQQVIYDEQASTNADQSQSYSALIL